MPLKLELELTDDDLSYYRKLIDDTRQRNAKRDVHELVASTRRLLDQRRKSGAPAYVKKRLDDLSTLASLLEDAEWPLEEKDRQRIVVAISYFATPIDMIKDSIPGLGFLDDALMAEILMQELEHELAGYREFCEYREQEEARRGKDAHVGREDWLAEKRRQIRYRIERRWLESGRHGSTDSPTDPILAYLSDGD